MKIRNIIKVLFVSLTTILMVGQLKAQESDSALVQLGYDIAIVADEVSSAVGVATAKDLSKYWAVDPTKALYGQIPGLMVLQNGGDQNSSMYVRGYAPMVLIDGINRSLSTISIAEIESVTVLKDAAATVMYGQWGANGVILVTTKRGVDEGLKVDFSYERVTLTPFRMPKMLDAYGYGNAMNEALSLDGQDYLYSREQLDAYKNGTYPDYYPNVNWFEEVLRETSSVDDFNATFRGGAGRTRYFVSMNYQGGEGLLKQDQNPYNYSTQLAYDRINLRTNLDIEVTKTTMLKFNLAGRISGTNRPGRATGSNLFGNLYGTPANAHPVKFADGMWGGTPVYGQNPVAEVNETGYVSAHERTFYADWTLTQDLDIIVDGLSASAVMSYDNNVSYLDQKTKDFTYAYRTAAIDEVNGELYDFTSTTFGENTALAYNTSFGGQNRHASGIIRLNYDQLWGKHKLNAVALLQADKYVGLGQSTTFHGIDYAGHLHYTYDSRYLADFGMSYSGNNILPNNNRYRFYPAVSLGWVISNESFMSDVSAVNLLKLRASAGLVGLALGLQYLHLERYGNGGSYFYGENNNSQGGLQEDRRANPDVDPEKSLVTNIGIDALLFGGLHLNVDAFFENRSNILVSESSSTSNVIGLPSTFVTDGIIENKGFEVGAMWTQNIGDFSYAIGAQYSLAQNKIIEQNEVFREWDYLKRTGLPVGQAFGLQDDGFWGVDDGLNGVNNTAPDGTLYTFTQVLKPGDVKYIDQNGDKIIDQFDVSAIGHSWLPEVYYSFTLDVTYKGIGINAILQGARNVSTTLNTAGIFWPLYNNNNISTFSNDRWTPATAETATLPRLTPEKNNNNYRSSTIWQRDASFLKLRVLELYYDLPERVVQKIRLQRARVFARGLNLFSVDNIEIMDPEYLGTGYPSLKSYNVGISIGF